MQELHVKSLLPVRLDKYLMEQFPALGLGRLNKALRENKIKLNGKKQPLATRVQNGDVIRVYLLDDQLGLTSQEGPEFLQARAPAEFIYENDDLIVANKPAGIPVDGDESDTLLNRVLRRLYEEKRWDAAHEPRLCHRLDTGTSGRLPKILPPPRPCTAGKDRGGGRIFGKRHQRAVDSQNLPVRNLWPPGTTRCHAAQLFNERFCAWHCAHSGRAEIRCKRDHYRI